MSSLISVVCKICNNQIESPAHFWKTHKIKEADYYLQYYPKKDLETGEIIQFKNRDNYFINDFNNKINLKKYCKKLNELQFVGLYKEILTKRKNHKNLKYALGEFESKSVLMPPTSYVIRRLGITQYLKICEEVGLVCRYDYTRNLEKCEDFELKEIKIDTREQRHLSFNYPIIIEKLDEGDYAPNPNPNNIVIERKSLIDYCGTASQGLERFKKELTRAKNNNIYIFIVIEDVFKNLQSIEYLPHTRRVKAGSEFLLHNIRDLYNEFDNFQVIAAGNRSQCSDLIERIFKSNAPQKLDIQYILEEQNKL